MQAVLYLSLLFFSTCQGTKDWLAMTTQMSPCLFSYTHTKELHCRWAAAMIHLCRRMLALCAHIESERAHGISEQQHRPLCIAGCRAAPEAAAPRRPSPWKAARRRPNNGGHNWLWVWMRLASRNRKKSHPEMLLILLPYYYASAFHCYYGCAASESGARAFHLRRSVCVYLQRAPRAE